MAVVGFVLLAILALLLLLLCIPIVGSARFSSDAPGEAYVRWLFYRRQLLGKKQKKRSRAKKKQKKQKEQMPAAPAKKEKRDFAAIIGAAMDFVASLGGGTKMLLPACARLPCAPARRRRGGRRRPRPRLLSAI